MKTILVYIHCIHMYFFICTDSRNSEYIKITLILELPDTCILIFLSLCRFLKVPERYILASNIFLLSSEQTQNPDCALKQIFTVKINDFFVDIYFNVLINVLFLHQNPRQVQLAYSERVQQAPLAW